MGEVPIHKWFCPACIRDVAMGLWRGGCGDGYRHESRVGPCFQVALASLPAPRAQYQLSPVRGRGGVKVPLVELEAERKLERSPVPVAVSPSDRSAARVARGSHSSTAAATPAATAAATTTSPSRSSAEPTGQDLPLLKKPRGRPPNGANGQRMQWHGTKEAGRWVEADWHSGSCWRSVRGAAVSGQPFAISG